MTTPSSLAADLLSEIGAANPPTKQDLSDALTNLRPLIQQSLDGNIAGAWMSYLFETLSRLRGDPARRVLLARIVRRLCEFCEATNTIPETMCLPSSSITDVSYVTTTNISVVLRGSYNGSPVAIKCLGLLSQDKARTRKRAFTEAVVWYTLAHPNIVPFVGVLIDWLPPLSIPAAKPVQLEYAPSSHEGTWAVSLVSQWIGVAPGANLSHFLADMDLSLGQRLHLIRDVLRGLTLMHSVQFAHGDLKSTNILVDETGNARINDLGNFWELQHSTGLRSSKATVGTLGYSAPEVVYVVERDFHAGVRPTGHSDVYSFAVLICEILSGQTPYAGATTGAIIEMRQEHGENPYKVRPAVIASTTYSALWDLVERAWDDVPLNRPNLAAFAALAYLQ